MSCFGYMNARKKTVIEIRCGDSGSMHANSGAAAAAPPSSALSYHSVLELQGWSYLQLEWRTRKLSRTTYIAIASLSMSFGWTWCVCTGCSRAAAAGTTRRCLSVHQGATQARFSVWTFGSVVFVYSLSPLDC